MIARSLTLTLVDPVAAIPAVLLFRLSAGARGKSSGSLPDASMLRVGSPKPVILAGGRAFLGSSVASVIPNAGLGEAATAAAAAAGAAAAAAAVAARVNGEL